MFILAILARFKFESPQSMHFLTLRIAWGLGLLFTDPIEGRYVKVQTLPGGTA